MAARTRAFVLIVLMNHIVNCQKQKVGYGTVKNIIEIARDMIKLLNQFFKFKEKKKTPAKLKNGKWKEFNKNAILISEGFYVEGLRDGLWRFYYDTGELLIEEEYNRGKKHGKYNSFFRCGNLMSQGKFLDDIRQGKFKVYSEQGKLTKVMVFKDDELIEEINPSYSSMAAQQQLKYDLPMLLVFISYLIYWSAQLV